MPLGPAVSWPRATIPPPVPVPTITPKTTAAPAPAPSVASETAKQLASFAKRIGRPILVVRSSASGRPISQVELAFLTQAARRRNRPRDADPNRADVGEVFSIVPNQTNDGLGVSRRNRRVATGSSA